MSTDAGSIGFTAYDGTTGKLVASIDDTKGFMTGAFTTALTGRITSVDSYLGTLRVRTPALIKGESRCDVHVSATKGFKPSSETLIASHTMAGVTFVNTEHGEARYIRVVFYRTNGKPKRSKELRAVAIKPLGDDVVSLSMGDVA